MKQEGAVSNKKEIVVGLVVLHLAILMAIAICTTGTQNTPRQADSRIAPAMQVMDPAPGQLAAFGQTGLTLPMGVTLVGKGYIDALVPGSPAARAGLQVGDVINRINGR